MTYYGMCHSARHQTYVEDIVESNMLLKKNIRNGGYGFVFVIIIVFECILNFWCETNIKLIFFSFFYDFDVLILKIKKYILIYF
jgi:hypothetical protein